MATRAAFAEPPLPLAWTVQTTGCDCVSWGPCSRGQRWRGGDPDVLRRVVEIERDDGDAGKRVRARLRQVELNTALNRMLAALNAGDVDQMLEHLKVFFAGVPNTITLDHEKYYQTIFFTVFKLIGAVVEAETSTNTGRIDAVVKTDTDISIFEFKLHGTAEDALAQIRDKHYAQPYLDDGRCITLIGAAFDPATRSIERWLAADA